VATWELTQKLRVDKKNFVQKKNNFIQKSNVFGIKNGYQIVTAVIRYQSQFQSQFYDCVVK